MSKNFAGARTEEGLAFDAYLSTFQKHMRAYERALRQGEQSVNAACAADPIMEEIRELNELFINRKELMPQDVQHLDVLQNLSVMYRNDEFIGTRVMPIVYTNGKLNGTYFKYPKEDRTAYPDDTVGIGGRVQPNEISQTREEAEFNQRVRSFIEFIGWHTIQNQHAPLNELVDFMVNVLYGLEFRRELRIAGVVFNAANYPTGNKDTLSGGDQFSDLDDSDPIGVFGDMTDNIWHGNGPGRLVAVLGLDVYNVLRTHPQLLATIQGGATTGRVGTLTQSLMAQILGVDEILVPRVRHNTGTVAAPVYARMWNPKMVSVLRTTDAPSTKNAVFGYSFTGEPPKNQMFWNEEEGAAGVYKARATLSDDQKVVAGDCGFHLTDAVA